MTVERLVYYYCDITKLEADNDPSATASVYTSVSICFYPCPANLTPIQCVKYHPWLKYYAKKWPVKVIMQQTLARTSHTYRFEDWGEDDLLKRIRKRSEEDDDDEVRTRFLITFFLPTDMIDFFSTSER